VLNLPPQKSPVKNAPGSFKKLQQIILKNDVTDPTFITQAEVKIRG